MQYIAWFFFKVCAFFFKDQCMILCMYRMLVRFCVFSVLYIYIFVLWKKNVPCTSFPGKLFLCDLSTGTEFIIICFSCVMLLYSIYFAYRLINCWLARWDTNRHFILANGAQKTEKTWYLFSIPTWGLLQTSELAGWAQVTIKNSQIPWRHYMVTEDWRDCYRGV